MSEYRIEYSIQRKQSGEEDFTEIGFGSSSAWDDLESAIHALGSDIQNGIWETEPGQPDPAEVVAEILAAREAGR